MMTHRISVLLPAGQSDLACGAFYAAGFTTVLMQEPGDLGTEAVPVPPDKVRLVGFLEEGDDADARLAVLRGVLGKRAPLVKERFEDEDWLQKFRAHHRAVRVGSGLVVAPPWSRVADKKGRIVLRIDPGLAFGTGSHASTYLCLRALQDLSRKKKRKLGRVLDVGTGSGLLAFAALRLGATSARAIEPDPDALASARGNAKLNGFITKGRNVRPTARAMPAHPARGIRAGARGHGLTFTGETADAVRGRYDVVLANLVRDLLLATAKDLTARVAKGGTLVVAGLLDTQADDVRVAFEAQGMALTKHRKREGWSALELAR